MDNFKKNSSLLDGTIEYKVQTKIACLASAGPSLNETVHCLLTCQSKVDIYVVGAALKVLLANGVFQKTAVLSDRSEFTLEQFENTEFKGELFYLSTTHHQTVVNHNGPRFILYQKGYQLAEKRGTSELFLEIRGSVGTTTFSLLEQLGYKKMVLFGQDLGFYDNYTHAQESPSNKQVVENPFLRKELENDGSIIYTSPSLQTFKFWYDQKMHSTKVKVYNTATKGAKIKNVPLKNEQQFQSIINGDT